jgi:hypothetical protein
MKMNTYLIHREFKRMLTRGREREVRIVFIYSLCSIVIKDSGKLLIFPLFWETFIDFEVETKAKGNKERSKRSSQTAKWK